MSDPYQAIYEEIIHEHYKKPKYRTRPQWVQG